MRIRATLTLHGKTATGISVPPDVVEQLGGGKRPAARVTINGHTYRSTVAVYGGEYLVGVSAENRATAGVDAGDVLDVDLELDTAPREVVVPDDLAAALARVGAARAFFDGLSYSNKRAIVESVESAKKAETRLARVEKTVGMLREGRSR